MFKDLKNYTNFLLINIDAFIKTNKELEFQCNNNIIFQYCYILLSKYKFKNKEELINIFNNIHSLMLDNRYKEIDKFLNSLTKIQKNSDELNFIAEKVVGFN